MVSHTKLALATKELMHVRRLFTSSSSAANSTSKNTMSPSVRILISLVIVVFLVLVSVKGGSTASEFMAATAYFSHGNAIDEVLKNIVEFAVMITS
jgi:hypothetical protein